MNVRMLQLIVAGSLLLVMTHQGTAATQQTTSGLIYEQAKQWQMPYKPLDLVQSVDGKLIYVLTENSKVLVYEPNGALRGSIPVDQGVTAIDTDARGEKLLLLNSEKNTFTALSVDFVVAIDTTGSPFLGNANAPVTIAVFTDFE